MLPLLLLTPSRAGSGSRDPLEFRMLGWLLLLLLLLLVGAAALLAPRGGGARFFCCSNKHAAAFLHGILYSGKDLSMK